jgi:RNA polymerase sigma-70 factor (ECF subfamily)
MERYAMGDDSAFEEVYDAVAPRVLAYLRRQTRDDAKAEDLLQHTMLHVHRARGSFIRGAEVMPWVFAIARRLVIDTHRRQKRETLFVATELVLAAGLLAPAGTSEDLVQARQVEERVQEVLRKLPEAQRVAFELVKHDGLSLAEAAQVMGTSVASVKQRMHRAYDALRGAVSSKESA